MQFCKLNMLLEKAWADAYFTSSAAWTTKRVGSAAPTGTEFLKWTDPGSSPMTVVNDLRASIYKVSGGFEANYGAMDYATFQKMKTHPEIVDRIRYTTDESVQLDMIKRYFGLDVLVICGAIMNTANAGATATMDYITGSGTFLLAYVTPDPAISADAPSAGYTFWNEGMEGSINGLQVVEVPIPERRVIRIESQVDFKMHMLAPALGGLLTSII